MSMDFHTVALPETTKTLISNLQTKPPEFLSSFYLSGGTALSLQIGHRVSEDLDFFTQGTFDGELYIRQLSQIGKLSDTSIDSTSVNTYLDGVKIQLLYYPYQLLEPTILWEHIHVSSILDIACTKLITVSQRGSKKDFIDLFFLLESYPLKELFIQLDIKYTNIGYNKLHILKALQYFEDADSQPLPRMIAEVTWNLVKETIGKRVKEFPIPVG